MWIKCIERLPEKCIDVLVICEDKVIMVAFIREITTRYRKQYIEWDCTCKCEDRESVQVFDVIWWMPLPEEPKE
jgi:hypothetical protein